MGLNMGFLLVQNWKIWIGKDHGSFALGFWGTIALVGGDWNMN